MDTSKYLSRYHNMKIKLEKLEYLHEEYIRMSHSIPGVQFDRIRVSGTKSLDAPFVKWILKKVDVEAEIKELEKELSRKVNLLIETIDNLESIDEKTVLTLRYVQDLS